MGSSNSIPVLLKNTSASSITISTGAYFQTPGLVGNFDYSISGSPNGKVIAPGGSVSFKVFFKPVNMWVVSGEYIITGSDGSSVALMMDGSGVSVHTANLAWNAVSWLATLPTIMSSGPPRTGDPTAR